MVFIQFVEAETKHIEDPINYKINKINRRFKVEGVEYRHCGGFVEGMKQQRF